MQKPVIFQQNLAVFFVKTSDFGLSPIFFCWFLKAAKCGKGTLSGGKELFFTMSKNRLKSVLRLIV
ncbi:hypothetical protein NC99_29560 [Sunxiuqinia dokdonensis]|uniref:Uncharacterized protein n=1 Tax=Sunxiuqinia dokdonensis TaxID=1409788 RepID=A0A0L8V6Y1_9BACT|nr:hypothetical protein NC99_29560 [Sunxiuqinia dokdonensis]